MEKYLLGCDWGTSSFRLGLFDLRQGILVAEIQSGDGMSGLHRAWQNDTDKTTHLSKEAFLLDRLSNQIQVLSARLPISLDHIPVLISGMASSSIGIADLPYAHIPFSLDGAQVKSKRFNEQKSFPHEIILISGVQSQQDVMRGEETQLIGIWSLLTDRGLQPATATIIFPGTHSKHIYIKDETLVGFKTFMTGEMYQVTGNNSILKDSIDMIDDDAPTLAEMKAFRSGVQHAADASILNSLFTVRTNQLFKKLTKTENAFFLSGLLIGSELDDLIQKDSQPLFLCSGKKLSALYKTALEELGLAGRTSFVPATLVESAAMTGQKIIYDQYVNNKLLNE